MQMVVAIKSKEKHFIRVRVERGTERKKRLEKRREEKSREVVDYYVTICKYFTFKIENLYIHVINSDHLTSRN